MATYVDRRQNALKVVSGQFAGRCNVPFTPESRHASVRSWCGQDIIRCRANVVIGGAIDYDPSNQNSE
jgi:hypothetical protein